jgi:putative component of toxin-antitoxin plasmid stabilization module
MSSPPVRYEIEFYATDSGRQPAAVFLDGLEQNKKIPLLAAIDAILRQQGKDVCQSEHGKNLGDGLFEFRIRGERRMALRVYFHPHGNKIILLLGGFDKGRFGEGRREQRAIKAARRNLADWKRSNP